MGPDQRRQAPWSKQGCATSQRFLASFLQSLRFYSQRKSFQGRLMQGFFHIFRPKYAKHPPNISGD
jgi:hypothetical protein